MNKNTLDELLSRIRALEEQVEEEYRHRRDEFAQKRAALAAGFLAHQRQHKVGLFRFLSRANVLVVLTAPVIYAGWIPFLLIDLFVTLYQTICFPIYGIPRVKRSDYMVFDRELLPYLNLIEKFNCFYCSYGNGVAAYVREIASRTEQYWCPIKHARRVRDSHDRYHVFFEHGDAEAYRRGLDNLRKEFEATKKAPACAEDEDEDQATHPRT